MQIPLVLLRNKCQDIFTFSHSIIKIYRNGIAMTIQLNVLPHLVFINWGVCVLSLEDGGHYRYYPKKKESIFTQNISYYLRESMGSMKLTHWPQMTITCVCYMSLQVVAFWFPNILCHPPPHCLGGVTLMYIGIYLRIDIMIKSMRFTCQK